MQKLFKLLCLTIAGLCISEISYAGVRYVGTWTGGQTPVYTALQDAITAAASGDEIWVAKGTYTNAATSINANWGNYTFLIKSGVSVYGGFAGMETSRDQRNPKTNVTTLQAASGARVLYLSNTTIASAVWDGLTITGGNLPASGGTSLSGGGIALRAGNVTFSNCIIEGNTVNMSSGEGGGVYTAVAASTGSAYFKNCIIRNNSVTHATGSRGGGVSIGNYTYVQNSLIIANTSNANGGAINLGGGSAVVDNCLVVGNTSKLQGGAVYAEVSGTLSNTTIVKNNSTTANNTGGVYSSAKMFNVIIWGNTTVGATIATSNMNASYAADNSAIQGYSLTAGTNCIVLSAENDKFSKGPGFVNPVYTDVNNYGDWSLKPGSQCINTGTNTSASITDILGNPRFEIRDMGAYEYNPSNPLPVVYVKQGGTGDGSSWANATGNLQTAVFMAGGSTPQVWVAKGTYNGDFIMREGVAVYGGFAGNESSLTARDIKTNPTILNGNAASRVLTQPIEFTKVTVWDGFTIANGKTLATDGRIEGAGAYLLTYGRLINCIVVGNEANTNGGGIYMNATNIENCLVVGNTLTSTTGYGAGIYREKAADIINCTIVRNKLNSTNEAYGTGLYATNNAGYIYNSIIWGNRLSSNVDANSQVTGVSLSASRFLNTAMQTASLGTAGLVSGTTNIRLSATGKFSKNDPQFRNPVYTNYTNYGDWSLKGGSVCMDKGDNTKTTLLVDLNNNTRKNGTVDMGAYEYNPSNPLPIVYVKPTAVGTGDGSSWANATSDLQEAVYRAIGSGKNGQVWVAKGTYTGDFIMKDRVDVYGGFAGTETQLNERNTVANVTILDGATASRVLTQRDNFNTTSKWDGFTIQNGYVRSGTQDHPTDKGSGGGVYLRNKSVLSNCIVVGNKSDAYAARTGGGGIYSDGASRIENCLVVGNTAYALGGGICTNAANAPIVNCTVVRNRVTNGVTMRSMNTSPYTSYVHYGCGIYTYSGTSPVYNCMVWGNYFGTTGTTVNNTQLQAFTKTVGIYNCGIHLYYKTGNNYGLGYTANAMVFLDTPNNRYQGPGFVNPVATPTVSNYGDWHLLAGARGVNAGINSMSQTDIDLDGKPRKLEKVDLGAYEYVPEYTGPTIYVKQGGSGNKSGKDWANAIDDINEAVGRAIGSTPQVWVARGTYYGDFIMKEGVSVYGGFEGAETVISDRSPKTNTTILSGDLNKNGFDVTDARVLTQSYDFIKSTTWDGFTMTGGYASVSSSYAPYDMKDGGGAYLRQNGRLTGCTIKANKADRYAGGVFLTNGGHIINSSVLQNTASNYGGGLYAELNGLIINTESSGNSGSTGGGIYVTKNAKVVNCLVANNNNGGVYQSGNAQIINSTIVRNSSYGISLNGSARFLANSIVWGNASDAIAGNGYNKAYVKNSALTTGATDTNLAISTNNTAAGTGVFFVNPTATVGTGGYSASANWRLGASSACLAKGSNIFVTEGTYVVGAGTTKPVTIKNINYCSDLDKNIRIWDHVGNVEGGTVDAGAYEYLSQVADCPEESMEKPTSHIIYVSYDAPTNEDDQDGTSWETAFPLTQFYEQVEKSRVDLNDLETMIKSGKGIEEASYLNPNGIPHQVHVDFGIKTIKRDTVDFNLYPGVNIYVKSTAAMGVKDTVNYIVPLNANNWENFSLPFTSQPLYTLSDEYGNSLFQYEDVQNGYAIRYYDAVYRALNGSQAGASSNSWKDLLSEGQITVNTGDEYEDEDGNMQPIMVTYDTYTLKPRNGYIGALYQNPAFGNYTNVRFRSSNAATAIPGASNVDVTLNTTTGGTASTKAQDKYWNYVGNPYTSYYKMPADATRGVSQPGAFYHPKSTGGYDEIARTDEAIILPFAPIMFQTPVNVSGTPQYTSVTFTPGNRIDDIRGLGKADSKVYFRSAEELTYDAIKLIVQSKADPMNSDLATVVISDQSTEGYDIGFDLIKSSRTAGEISLGTLLNGNTYGVNEIPATVTSLPIEIKAPKAGTYTISLTNATKLRPDTKVYLVDNMTKTEKLVEAGSSFEFMTTSTGIINRYSLRIDAQKSPTGIDVIPTEKGNLKIYADYQTIVVEGINAQTVINVFDMSGRRVESKTASNATVRIPMSGTGVFVVKAYGNNQTTVQKVIIKQ